MTLSTERMSFSGDNQGLPAFDPKFETPEAYTRHISEVTIDAEERKMTLARMAHQEGELSREDWEGTYRKFAAACFALGKPERLDGITIDRGRD